MDQSWRHPRISVEGSGPLEYPSGTPVGDSRGCTQPYAGARCVLRIGMCRGWNYDRVSIGYPSRVGPEGSAIRTVIARSGMGWFRIATELGKSVRIINHAAMQALGSYDGGRSASATTSQLTTPTHSTRVLLRCLASPGDRPCTARSHMVCNRMGDWSR